MTDLEIVLVLVVLYPLAQTLLRLPVVIVALCRARRDDVPKILEDTMQAEERRFLPGSPRASTSTRTDLTPEAPTRTEAS